MQLRLVETACIFLILLIATVQISLESETRKIFSIFRAITSTYCALKHAITQGDIARQLFQIYPRSG